MTTEIIKISLPHDIIKTNTIIVIAGPTASGKSKLAMEIARQHNGVIINGDSLQVYKDLSILSARPSPKDEQQIPHKLYGFLDYNESCSAALWLEKTLNEINNAHQNQQLPIVVGGTGMYLRTLYQGIAEIPNIPQEIITQSKEMLKNMGNQKFHHKLMEIDPIMGKKLHPNDSQRILRAYNVKIFTGKSLAEYQQNNENSKLKVSHLKLFTILILPKSRESLKQKAAQRFNNMINNPRAIEEVKNIMTLDNNKINPILKKAIGVPQIIQYLNNEISKDKAIELSQIATNQYIKRQITWFKNQLKNIADMVIEI